MVGDEVTMLEQIVGGWALTRILLYSLFFGVFVGLAWLFQFFLRKVAKRLTHKTTTRLGDAIVSTLEKPVMAVIILAGVYLATLSFPMETILRRYTCQGLSIMLSLLGIYIAVALFDVVIRWYLREVLSRRKEVGLGSRLLNAFRVGVFMVAVLLAALVTLRILGINSTPITGWLGGHGWRVALIVLLAMGAIVAVGEFLPKLIASTLNRRAGESEGHQLWCSKPRKGCPCRAVCNPGESVSIG